MSKLRRIAHERPWVKNYDPHVPASLDYPNTTLNELFVQAANKFSAKPFISHKAVSFTYKEVNAFVDALAKNLIYLGLKKNDRVALILPNIPQFVVAYYAILKAGGIVVAMNPNYKLNEFTALFHDSRPKFIFCLKLHQGIISELEKLEEIKSVIFTVEEDAHYLGKSGKHEKHIKTEKHLSFMEVVYFKSTISEAINFPEILPSDPAVFQFSGGTTGSPKAAVGLHRNLAANVAQFKTWCDLKSGQETILAVIPLYHVYGMVLALNLGASVGAKIVLDEDPRNIEFILQEIENHSVTFYPGVPSMYYAINQYVMGSKKKCDLTSIKACISGSAPLHPQIKADFEKLTGGKLVEGYGLSEAPTATHCNPLFGENKSGSIGLPLPDVDCRVVDLETGNLDMPFGETGELVIQGPQIMQGYFGNPAENMITLRDGWLYTGDVVKIDKDGYFYIIDRKKSLIKVGGFQVWPNEIEAVLNAHPKIQESAVGGVPDLEKGEKVIAWVVVKNLQKLDISDILDWCEGHLVYYKIPSEVIFIDSIPRTGVGKILRRELIGTY